mmetsp:Transcript_38480/g.90478  ORF Transcript_38480/g.90478 Transcript_38480/m.90478 type:complete len:371 (-) Transcript_38480:1183-2295(-)
MTGALTSVAGDIRLRLWPAWIRRLALGIQAVEADFAKAGRLHVVGFGSADSAPRLAFIWWANARGARAVLCHVALSNGFSARGTSGLELASLCGAAGLQGGALAPILEFASRALAARVFCAVGAAVALLAEVNATIAAERHLRELLWWHALSFIAHASAFAPWIALEPTRHAIGHGHDLVVDDKVLHALVGVRLGGIMAHHGVALIVVGGARFRDVVASVEVPRDVRGAKGLLALAVAAIAQPRNAILGARSTCVGKKIARTYSGAPWAILRQVALTAGGTANLALACCHILAVLAAVAPNVAALVACIDESACPAVAARVDLRAVVVTAITLLRTLLTITTLHEAIATKRIAHDGGGEVLKALPIFAIS